MAAQLTRIVELVHAGKATVQIIPFDVGAYPASDCTFVLLEFSEPVLPPVVYVEGLTTSQYHERPADLAQYREAVEYQRNLGLSPRESVELLNDMRKTYVNK
jgi:hypothetical protein